MVLDSSGGVFLGYSLPIMRNPFPAWDAKGVLNPASQPFELVKSRLASVLALMDRVDDASPRAAADYLKLAESARALARTMLTACDAQRSMNALASRIVAERQRLLSLLEAMDERTAAMVKALGETASGEDRLIAAARRWQAVRSRQVRSQRADRRVAEPIRSLYSRVKAGMKLELPIAASGYRGKLSAAAAEGVLKTTEDPAVRRLTFGACNAWYAENASIFAELLNAAAGCRVNILEREGKTFTEASAAGEGVSVAVFDALMTTVESEADAVHPAVTLRAEVFAGKTADGETARMPAAFLAAPPPFVKTPAALATFEGAVKAVKTAVADIAPDAPDFIDREIAAGWVESRSLAGGEGGSWTDEVPSASAVAVFADWQPTIGRAFELAHTFGEAYLRQQLLSEPALLRRPAAVLCETVGRLFSHALLVHLVAATKGDKAAYAAVLWQGLLRLSKNLLDLPFRCRLIEAVQEARRTQYLSVGRINDLTEAAWRRAYGETTDGCDQYVWAHKIHFYRTETLHYDWQYTFGFLASAALFDVLKMGGRTAAGATLADFCRESAWTDAESLFQKHLAADIASGDFWRGTLAQSLFPIALAAAL